jgi:hypothetical protein
MPQFQITAAERWSMKVWYEIDAPSAAEAVRRVKDCDAEPTTHEFLLNDQDDVEEILEASSDGEPLDVTPYNDGAATPGPKKVRAAPAESECPLESLDEQQLFDIVSQIQKILWYDDREERWDSDREWNSQTIEWVAGVLEDYGLQPLADELVDDELRAYGPAGVPPELKHEYDDNP